MGDRAEVKVIDREGDAPVYLYTHWNGHNLKEVLAEALGRKERWDDAPYLTRIIFSHMIAGEETSSTGYGISTTASGDAGLVLTVNVGEQTVGIDYGLYGGVLETCSFDKYVKQYG